MPKALDPFWEYGSPDVSSPELIQKSLEAIEEKDKKKEEAERNKAEHAGRSFGISYPDSGVEDIGPSGPSGRGSTTGTPSHATTSVSARSSFFVPRTGAGAQPGIKSLVKKKEKQEADRVMGRCIFWSDLPLSITKTNPFWQPMCDAIVVVGPGYKSATYEELWGPILQVEKQDINSRLAELKKTWEVTRCTMMSNGWTDRKGRTLLNFLNVVQVITDNAANCVSAGRMLMERHPTLLWTPCAAHCLDLLLEDMGKLSFIKEAVDMARSIPKFIYNHAFVLSLMRRFTRNKELRRPAITRFATTFITLQSLLRRQFELKQMFVSDDWRNCRYNRRLEGKAIAKMVYYETFWHGVEEACAVSEPIVKFLRLVDGEKPAMPYLYEGMDRAMEAIRSYYADKGSAGLDRQMMLWDVLDSRWTGMLHRPIHAAALFLNPAFSYKCNFDFDGKVMEGLHSCIQRMVPDPELCNKINREIQSYQDCVGLFGFDDAIRERTLFMPHIWWRSYGERAPNLQKLAIRILSQTCSSLGCERNWSVFEKIHFKKRNKYNFELKPSVEQLHLLLEFARFNDLVYVHYNIRLRVRQIESPMDPDAISLDNIDVLSLWRVEESPSWLEPVADDPLEQGQQEEDSESEEQQHLEEEHEEQEEEDTAGASTSTPSAIDIGEHSSIPSTHYLTLGAEAGLGPSTTRGRPGKQPIMFSHKRGRGQ
eukprot:PITA_19910